MAIITNNPGQSNVGNVGDTVRFLGTANFTGKQLPGDRTYWFERLTGGSGSTPALIFRNAANLVVTGLLDNANIALETCSKFVVDVTAQNLRNRSGNGTHVIYHNLCTDGEFTGKFIDQLGAGVDTCIFGNDPRRVKFNAGSFKNVHEAIHVFWYSFDPNNPWDCYFERNVVAGIERHAIELQGCANGCYVRRNHISGRVRDGINLSIATGGKFSAGGYENTANIEVDDNVCDNTGFNPSHYSQCMGIELMGRAKCRRNFIVNSGQAIAVTYNPPDTVITDNKFLRPTLNNGKPVLIVSDQPSNKYIVPQPANFTGNVIVPDSTPVPTASETTGGSNPIPPPPPPPPPTVPPPKLTSYFTKVKVEALPGAVIEKRAGIGGYRKVTLDANGFDTDFDFDPVSNEVLSKWKFFYIQTLPDGSESDEAEAQIGINPDPAPNPTPLPTTTDHELTFTVMVDGQPVTIKRTVKVTATGARTVAAN